METNFDAATLTVRLGAIAGNYRTLKNLASGAALAGVVKADGYGLGAAQVAPALAGVGCDTFFVARLAEGVALRPLVPKARIFVLDGASQDAAAALIAHNLTPVLNDLSQIAAWSAAAKSARLDCAIHVDTGMNRLGLPQPELAMLAAEWKSRLAGLNLVLLMSHLACSDEPGNAMNGEQLSRFRAALAMLPPTPASLAASGGILLGKEYLFDLARPGVSLYGANPQPGGKNPVSPVAVLKARVLQTRRIDKGESVGYGATFRAKRPSLIATLALGYADGILRALSGKGLAFAAGKSVPMVGRVSMDLIGLDVTDAGPVKAGDEVELLGDHILLDDVALAAGTNAYEILTSLGRRITRHYTDHAA